MTAVSPGPLPGLDEDENSCWQHFLESSSLFLDTLNRELVDVHRLTLSDVQLLELLAKSDDGSARMGDLAQALMLQPSRINEQVGRLESDGLVVRESSKRDRRGVVARVTSEGRGRLKRALVTYARLVRAHYLNQLSRAQMTALGESSRRVAAGMKTRMTAGIRRR